MDYSVLFNYQKHGVRYLLPRDAAILADDMGLGKSLQIISLINYKDLYPALIICPASVKFVWQDEFKKWANIDSSILSTKQSIPFTPGKVTIINYDVLAAWGKEILKHNYKVIIGDEAHYIKNHKAIRSKAFRALAKRIPKKYLLTGTPMLNRPIDLYHLLHIVSPDKFPSWWDYAKRYCNLRHNGYGWDAKGATRIPELRQLIAP